ncbi:MAG: TonB-dependent receptor [Pseudomonadota bacterium]
MNQLKTMSVSFRAAGLVSAAILLCTGTTLAQESTEEPRNELEEIVVTGTTRAGVTVLESSVAITAISEEDLVRDVPFGLVDTLKAVPGLFVQESGGQTSNSIGVRGLPSTAQLAFISVQEDGLPVNYERYTVDAVQRYSIGIERVEVTRGGTSGVLAPNGAGAIVNYINKKGTQDPEGTLRLSLSDFDNVRTDFFYGGPLSDDWTVALSGYYMYGDTPRENEFNGERGGQVRVNLTRELERGELNISYKKVDEQNSFVLPLPVARDPNSGELSEIPGFDLNHGNVAGFDNSRTRILFANGEVLEQNIVDGADAQADVFIVDFDWDFGNDWFLQHASRVSDLQRLFNAHFTGSAGSISILPAEVYLTDDSIDFVGAGYGTVGDFYAANPGTSRCFQYVTTKELLCAGDPALDNLNGNGLAQILNSLREPIERRQFISDTRLTWETENNSLSFGALFIDLDHNRALASSLFMSEVTSDSPQVLDIVAVDANGDVQAFLSDGGVVKHGQWRGDDDVQVNSLSLYINDEFQVNDRLRIDAGLRWEDVEYQAVSLTGLGDRVPVAGALDQNGDDVDNILANNFANRLKGNGGTARRTVNYDDISWTIGFNYMITDNIATYGRYAEGYQTPRADRLGDLILNTPDGPTDTPLNEVELAELGVRYSGDTIAASATLYSTSFPSLLTGGFGFDSGGTQVINQAELDVVGIEFDLSWSPTDWLNLQLAGVVQDGELDNFNTPAGAAFNGNKVARTPDEQFRFIGNIYATDRLTIFGDYHWLGERYGANDNVVRFESCGNLGLGASYAATDQITFQLKGKNITDEVCYTEGNPRATVVQNLLQLGYARPIAGATYIVSAQFDFF